MSSNDRSEPDGSGTPPSGTIAPYLYDAVSVNPPTEEPHLPWLGPGGKFSHDGDVLPYPGNTIIYQLSPETSLHNALLTLYDKLSKHDLGSLYILLPPSTWHMTVFEGVCDLDRQSDHWTKYLPLGASLEDCTADFKQKLQNLDIGCESSLRTAIVGWEPLDVGIGLQLRPADSVESRKLTQIRDRISEALQIRRAAHKVYSFHVSISYMLRQLEDQEKEQLFRFLQDFRSKLPEYVEFRDPEFCTFEDMFAYRRWFVVGQHDS